VSEAEAENPQEVEEFMDQQLFAYRVTIEDRVSVEDPASTRKPIHPRVRLVSGKYTGKWEEIGCFLETLELPQRLMTDQQRQVFRREATKFIV
jgi:hypothetical protein